MEAIGTASAILGVAQLGFTIAGTLFSFVSSIKGASTRIRRIQDDIERTALYARRLEGFVVDHNDQPCFNEDELENAQNILRDCELVFLEIRKLILDTGSKDKPANDELKMAKELDVSWQTRVSFPVLRKLLVEPSAHLAALRSHMALLYSGASFSLQIADKNANAESAHQLDEKELEEFTEQMIRLAAEQKRMDRKHLETKSMKTPGNNMNREKVNHRKYTIFSDDGDVEPIIQKYTADAKSYVEWRTQREQKHREEASEYREAIENKRRVQKQQEIELMFLIESNKQQRKTEEDNLRALKKEQEEEKARIRVLDEDLLRKAKADQDKAEMEAKSQELRAKIQAELVHEAEQRQEQIQHLKDDYIASVRKALGKLVLDPAKFEEQVKALEAEWKPPQEMQLNLLSSNSKPGVIALDTISIEGHPSETDSLNPEQKRFANFCS